MTAAALAASVGLSAYMVDLSALVSKYVGETEKSLSKVFDRAAREHCLLVFDEADAVFGARTEVDDAHDRYANQEVSYLLSRIEQHPGTVVLTTNLIANIDAAFQRRIHVMVEFPEPGPGERERLWRTVLPERMPFDSGHRPARPGPAVPAHRSADPRGDAGRRLPRGGRRAGGHRGAPGDGDAAPVREGWADGARVTPPVATRQRARGGPPPRGPGRPATARAASPVLTTVPRPVGDASVVAAERDGGRRARRRPGGVGPRRRRRRPHRAGRRSST